MLSDHSYGLQRPMLHDEGDAELDAISSTYSTGSMASHAIYGNNDNGVFFPSPSPSYLSLANSNTRPTLQNEAEEDEDDDGFLLGFGAGAVEAEDAHEAEYTAAESQKVLLEFDDHGADHRTAQQRQRQQQRATAALERSARQYRERVDAVLRGKHLITVAQAVELAGLQIQIEFGEYIRPGAIKLGLVLPQRYLGAKGVEAMCFAEHAKVKDMTDAEAREQYIIACRATRTYGALHTTMYEKIRGKSKRVTRIVGVTRKDLICVEPDTHEIAATYALSSIRRWATNDASIAASSSSSASSPSSSPSPSRKDGSSSDAAAAAADGPGSLTIWFGNGTTEGTVVRFETKRQAAASAAEALLITALKSSRKVKHASSSSASALSPLSAGYSEEGECTTDDGFHSPSPSMASQQRVQRRAQRRSSVNTPTSDYATTPEGTPELQRRWSSSSSSSGKKHRRSPSAARAAASAASAASGAGAGATTFALASPAASGISRRRSMSRASHAHATASASATASATSSAFSTPASSAPSSAASSPACSRRTMVASTKGDTIIYTSSPSPSPSPSMASGRASTTSLSKKNRRWSTASIESSGSVDHHHGSGAGAGAGRESATSPPNRWSWPQAAAAAGSSSGAGAGAGAGAAVMATGMPRTSPLRHSISASDSALNSRAGSAPTANAATYAVPRRHASSSLVVEVVPMLMPMQPSLDGDRASGGAVYDLLRSEMSRLRSSATGDYI